VCCLDRRDAAHRPQSRTSPGRRSCCRSATRSPAATCARADGRHGRGLLPRLDLARAGPPRGHLDGGLRRRHRGRGPGGRGGGHRAGFPFGQYDYADSLGPRLLDVPVVVPPRLGHVRLPLPGRRTAAGALGARRRRRRRAGPGRVGPVPSTRRWSRAGHWRFGTSPSRCRAHRGSPCRTTLGWLLVALLMLGARCSWLGRRPRTTGCPVRLFLWTLASSVLANAVFFGRPLVALTGGVVMGLVACRTPARWPRVIAAAVRRGRGARGARRRQRAPAAGADGDAHRRPRVGAAAGARRGAARRGLRRARCSARPASTSRSSCSTTARPTARPTSCARSHRATRACGC
jgi:putative membrane protein